MTPGYGYKMQLIASDQDGITLEIGNHSIYFSSKDLDDENYFEFLTGPRPFKVGAEYTLWVVRYQIQKYPALSFLKDIKPDL